MSTTTEDRGAFVSVAAGDDLLHIARSLVLPDPSMGTVYGFWIATTTFCGRPTVEHEQAVRVTVCRSCVLLAASTIRSEPHG